MIKIIILALMMATASVFSQVGIGTTSPHSSAVLDLTSTDKGFLLPRVANTDAITSPTNGMMVYDLSSNCIKTYEKEAWTACLSSASASVTVNCNTNAFEGSYTKGVAINGSNKFSVTLTNNSFSTATIDFQTSDLVLSGVSGITVTAVSIASATLNSGQSRLVEYSLSGTPTTSGTLTGTWTKITLNCVKTVSVAQISSPATIILDQNTNYLLASVYDQDYVPYTAPTGVATTGTQAADGTNETTAINFQGTITTTGVTVKIPVTATGSGTLPSYTTTTTIPANMTEDGISRVLTFSWAAQAYTSTTKTIIAKIVSVGGPLNAKKLDINVGIGTDVLGIVMGSFTYPYNNTGATTSYNVRDIAGIPDKMFEVADNTGSITSHRMVYLPMIAEDGKVWLNHNLGAHYTNMNHTSFNPLQQATSATDYLAYGSKFQWGRKPDGHELTTQTSSTVGMPINDTTTATKSDIPTTASFITISSGIYDWRVTPDDTLWATQASTNNPCPSGFRLPTETEFTTLVTAAGITNGTTAANAALKFTLPGCRSYSDGTLYNIGSFGYYWNGSVSNSDASYRAFSNSVAAASAVNRTIGFTIRCIKE